MNNSKTYTAIVADDRDVSRNRLLRLLKEYCPEISIAGQASDGIAARELITTIKPDLAFLDIEMPGMSGIEAAVTAGFSTHVIFVTGFNQYAVEAFKAFTVDYILKPISAKTLVAAVEKFKQMLVLKAVDQMPGISRSDTDIGNSQTLKVTVGNALRFIPFNEIICCEASDKYSTIHTQAGELLSNKSLAELEQILPSKTFIRIHRKHIVNFAFVKEVKLLEGNKYIVILNVPFRRELVVSRENINKVRSF